MKIIRWFYIFLAILFVLTGCSSSSENSMKDSGSKVAMESKSMESQDSSGTISEKSNETQAPTAEPIDTTIDTTSNMVIYKAEIQLRVKNFEKTIQRLEERATSYGGYIAESNVSKEGKEQILGNITIRIPQKNFQKFLHDAESQAVEVLQRNITGLDVTEEYVDLESRLKSKRAVEERLLSFMKNATKTEDLLKISADLAPVQEEIETVEGRMRFLQNQTSFSTVTMSLFETKVIIPKIDHDNLNTWERMKKQFVKSTNLLLSALSGLFVFVFGNLLVFLALVTLGLITFFYLKKRSRRDNQ